MITAGLLWIDLETTGLDPRNDQVLEVAAVLTDGAFAELARWQSVVQPHTLDLFRIDSIVRGMHLENGLFAEIIANPTLPGIDEVDNLLFGWLARMRQEFEIAAPPQIAGSTIGFDREFMRWHLPRTLAAAHYRSLDVTAFNEIARRHWPAVHEARPRGDGIAHRAMADVLASIETARYYAQALGPIGGVR